MKRLLLIAAMSACVLAKPKPETYKETEDFQYSRSSSDDGTKSGFYGAQRGNMGGNYERAHNMDNLAQNQMSGLVRQVDGELGEGAQTRTGSVYTAANSRGIYGSGNYDLSNLQGRNFAEGETIGNSQSHSSLSSHQNSRYGGHSYSGMESSAGLSSSHTQDARYSGYQTSGHADQRQIDNLHAFDASQGLGRYENNNQAGYNTNYHTQFGTHGRSEFDHSSANHHKSSGYDANSQAHYITTPVRVVMRPGGRVAIPITAPTYAVSQNVLENNNGLNSDAEILNQQGGSTSTNKAKHYEASYSYRKQWEKHHTVPGDVSVIVATENPFPKNSELYEDARLLQSSKDQLQNINSQTAHSDSINSNHRAYTKSNSNRSRFQAGYNSQQSQSGFNSLQNQAALHSQQSQSGLSSEQSHSDLNTQQSQSALSSQQSQLGFNSQLSSTSSGTRANAYGHNSQMSGMAADLTNAGGDVNSKPKSYHSSYSYHKSWERQGDPYVIKPAGGIYDGQASERLTAASSNSAAYSSHQYGTHSKQAHQSYSADCDDQGHLRVARSYNADQELQQVQNQWEDLGQQTHSKLENLEDFGQQQQDNLQELGQQTQNQWDNLQQLGQESQNQWDNLQQLGQQSQNQWDNLQQLGQQTQDKWDNLEDLGQQTHRDLEQTQNGNLEDFNQISQKDDGITNFEQQANNQNENLDVLSQHIQKENQLTDFQQQFNQNENVEAISQHTRNEDVFTHFDQEASNQNINLDILNQHPQNEDSLSSFKLQSNEQFINQEASNQNINLDILNQHTQNEDSLTNFKPQSNEQFINQQFQSENNQNKNDRDLFVQHQQNTWHQSNADEDKNIDTYDFMKPISQWTENSDKNTQLHEVEEKFTTGNDKQNIFPSESMEHNKFWFQNKDQNIFENTYYDQNTDNKNEHNFWNMNNFNNHFENTYPTTASSMSDTGHPLKNLWDTIDNIAGESTVTGGNLDDKKPFSDEFSQNQNVNHMQNSHGWPYLPVNTNDDLVNTVVNIEPEEKKSEHNNLFGEQTERTSTTVLPILTTSVENANIFINTHDANKTLNTQDEGRGDIGPEEIPLEIPIIDESHKTPQEIETLSLTKEPLTPKESGVIFQPSLIKNTDENKQLELFSSVQSSISTTVPSLEISTTGKINTIVISEQPSNQPILDALDLNTNPSSDFQKQVPHQQTVENVEIPENIQQQNLEQQYEDFSQLQNSWLPTNNLQQEYDQQNTEQQFEDFQQHESTQDQISLQDFAEQIQNPSQSLKVVPNKEIGQGNPSQNRDTVILSHPNNYEQKFHHPYSTDTIANTPQIMEPIYVSHTIDDSKDPNLLNNQKLDRSKSGDIQSPVETSSESPGFWKSLGNKFTRAKNKVTSWFSSSS